MVLCRIGSITDNGIINEKIFNKVKNTIDRCPDNEVLLLYIKSIGGEMLWASKIHFVLMEAKKRNIHTYAVGFDAVHSSALLIFLSCIFRTAYKQTRFLIHRAEPAEGDTTIGYKKMERDYFSFFAKITDISIVKYYNLANKNKYLSYEEALEGKIINIPFEKNLRFA